MKNFSICCEGCAQIKGAYPSDRVNLLVYTDDPKNYRTQLIVLGSLKFFDAIGDCINIYYTIPGKHEILELTLIPTNKFYPIFFKEFSQYDVENPR